MTAMKLFGMIMNNTLTWENHLFGITESKGLITKLSYRAYLILKLSKVMPKTQLKIIAEGIFFSILNYGIEAYGNVWGIHTLDDQPRNSPALNKEDNRKLQILVNNVLRSLTGLTIEASTELLHSKSNQLSVQQRCAFFTILLVHKTLLRSEPEYHHNRLAFSRANESLLRRNGVRRVDYRLSISRCSFFYRGSRLYNLLPEKLTRTVKLELFKKQLKAWVRSEIPLLPP